MPEMKEFPDGGVWDTLRSDDVYSEFLKQSYDETTTSQVAVGLNIAEHLRKLNECISLIDTEIHNQVGSKSSSRYEFVDSPIQGISKKEG